MSNLIQSPVVGTTVDVPTQAQGGTQLAASGGSIINSGNVAVSLAPNPPNNAQPAQTVTIQPNGSLPWPAGVACWAWTQVATGEVYVTPIQLPFSPGVIGAPSYVEVDPVTGLAPPIYATLVAYAQATTGAVIGVPANAWYLFDADLYQLTGGGTGVLEITGTGQPLAYLAVGTNPGGDHADLGRLRVTTSVDFLLNTPNNGELLVRYAPGP